MKLTTLALASAPLLLFAPSEGGLQAKYRTDVGYTYTQSDWFLMEASNYTVSINGEELPEEAAEQMGIGFPPRRMDTTQEQTTFYGEVDEGRPVSARRVFDTLEQQTAEGDEDEDLEGVLQGKTIVLEAGDGDGVRAEAELEDEDDDVDEEFLTGHRLTFAVEDYFPEDDVDEGDSWEISAEAARRILGLGEDSGPSYFDDDEDDEDGGFDEVLDENAEIEGQVTFQSIEERDGLRCALLFVELSVSATDVELDPDDLGGEDSFGEMDVAARMTVEISGTESVWFALDEGHPVASEGETQGTMEMVMELSDGEIDIEIAIEADLSSGLESNWTVE
ncbi:MAG: hypothetical protein AAF682_30985 [Planctomycetota bacterium]